MISHAIFLPLPISPHPAPHCLPLRLPPHPRLPPRASLHIPPCTPPSIPPELHLAPCTPLFTLLCAALLPPRIPSRPSPSTPPPPFPSSSLSQVSSSSSHRQVPPSTSLHLSPVHQSPIRVSPSSVFLSQVPPVDFLVRKKARFTHDMTFFRHDVRGKRFNAHEGSHKMEMIISKDHVAEKPRRGWDLWRHGRP